MAGVLIADDEIAIRQGLKKLIDSFDMGLQCVGMAADGRQALAMAEKLRPEILLIDINMPYMDGLEMIEKVKEFLPDSKIIVISGYDQYTYVRQALRLGIHDYLLKPLNQGALKTVLTEVLREFENQKEKKEDVIYEDVVDQVLHEIEKRYADKELRLSTLADEFFVSAATLSRGIKERTGQTFSAYLIQLRMEKAVELMKSSRGIMVYTLADQVGCSSQHYFCKLFKEHMGCTPTEYIKKRQEIQKKIK